MWPVEYQLRRYQLAAGAADDFIDAWKSGVVPLRKAHGFEIGGAWLSEDSNEFIWIIAHQSLADADRAYYASAERQSMTPDPAQYLQGGEELMMTQVDLDEGSVGHE